VASGSASPDQGEASVKRTEEGGEVASLAHDFLLAELRRGRTPQEIASVTCRSERTVLDYLAFHGEQLPPAPSPSRRPSDRAPGERARRLPLDGRDLERRYRRGATLEEIARQVGVSAKTVHRRLVEAKVSLRPAGPRPKRTRS
jgi:DNA-binding CsgD family transcriptional regulator